MLLPVFWLTFCRFRHPVALLWFLLSYTLARYMGGTCRSQSVFEAGPHFFNIFFREQTLPIDWCEITIYTPIVSLPIVEFMCLRQFFNSWLYRVFKLDTTVVTFPLGSFVQHIWYGVFVIGKHIVQFTRLLVPSLPNTFCNVLVRKEILHTIVKLIWSWFLSGTDIIIFKVDFRVIKVSDKYQLWILRDFYSFF